MIAGPILRRELRATAGRRGLFVMRTLLGVVLGVLFLCSAAVVLMGSSRESDPITAERVGRFGVEVLVMLAVVQVILWAILAPGLVAGTVAEERERGTLEALLLTRLSNAEILAHKLLGRLLPALSLLGVGLPFVLLGGWLASLPTAALALIVAMGAATMTFMSVLAVFASARCQKSGSAKALAMVLTWAWLLGPPVLAIIPAGGGNLLAEAFAPIGSACAWIAPSSPVSLAMPPFRASAGGIDPLRERAGWMLGTQAALSVPLLIAATRALGRRSGRPPIADPARDGRPPCGDDPVFWRESALPNRPGAPSRPLTLVRMWLTAIRQIAAALLGLALLTLVLAIPTAILAACGYYAARAFAEQWRFGLGSSGPFIERAAFNLVIRIVAGFSGFLWLISMAAGAAARITTERDKQTWTSLLTTPLTGREILVGKMRATARTFRPVAGTAAVLVALGVACGSLNPLGAVWVAADLPIAAWAGIAVGTWLGARPGTTAAASSHAAMASLGLAALHLPLILLALASAPEVASFGAMAGWIRLVVYSGLLWVPPATAWLAWAVTRRTFARFDEWADRPRRGPVGHPSPRA